MIRQCDPDDAVLSERIGHADTSITLKIYTHKSPGRDRELADRMGGMIKRALATVDATLVTDLVTDRQIRGVDESAQET